MRGRSAPQPDSEPGSSAAPPPDTGTVESSPVGPRMNEETVMCIMPRPPFWTLKLIVEIIKRLSGDAERHDDDADDQKTPTEKKENR